MAHADVPEWNPEDDGNGYLYERLAAHIAARITAGDLPPGARFPNEREMAAEYGVSIDSVRRATALLREQGLVRTLPNKGTYVRRPE